MNGFASLSPFLDLGEPFIFVIGAIFARVSAVVFLMPGIGERGIPVRVRLVAAVAITIVLAPIVTPAIPASPLSLTQTISLFTAESLSGLVTGFALRLMVFILQIAGSIIAQSLSLSQLFGPTVGFDSESPFAALLVMAGVALAMNAGVHFHVVGALAQTYEIFPFGVFPGGAETGEWSANRTGAAFFKALALSSPFVVLGFIYSLALAAASRAMPQLMAAFVGAPAITLAGLVLFAVAAPVILLEWLRAFERIIPDIFSGRL